MRFCPQCGTQISDEARFCPSCGAQVVPEQTAVSDTPEVAVPAAPWEKPADTQQPKPWEKPAEKKGLTAFSINVLNKFTLDFKKLCIIGGGLLALIVLIIVLASVTKSEKYQQQKGLVLLDSFDEIVYIIPVGKDKVEIDGYFSDYYWSLDGTKAAVLITDSSGDSSLYLVTDKVQKIAEDVYDFWYSSDGGTVVYAKEFVSRDTTSELWVYSGGKSTKIADNLYSTSGSGYVAVSPNGKTVAYTAYDGTDKIAVVWTGKVKEIGKDIYPIAVADGAKYFYYVKSGTLYAVKGTNTENKVKLAESYSGLYFNSDLTQIIFNSDSKGYISVKAGEKTALSGSVTGLLLPSGTAQWNGYSYKRYYIFGVKTFADTYYRNDSSSYSVIHITKKLETETIVRNASSASLASDGKTIVYLYGDSIRKINGSKAGLEYVTLVSGDVYSFRMTPNGKAVFFLTDDDELYYLKVSGKPARISEDVYSYALYNDKCFYFNDDGELFSSTGGKSTKISGIEGDYGYISANSFYVACSVSDGNNYAVYFSDDGKKFDLIYD